MKNIQVSLSESHWNTLLLAMEQEGWDEGVETLTDIYGAIKNAIKVQKDMEKIMPLGCGAHD